jgi:hypothetical protein
MDISEEDRRRGNVDLLILMLGSGIAVPIVFGLASAISGSTALESHINLIPKICEQIHFGYCDIHHQNHGYISESHFTSYLGRVFYYTNVAAVSWLLIVPLTILRYVRGVRSGAFSRRSTMDWSAFRKYSVDYYEILFGKRRRARAPLRHGVFFTLLATAAVDSLFFTHLLSSPSESINGRLKDVFGNLIFIVGSNFLMQMAVYGIVPLIVWRLRNGKSIKGIYLGDESPEEPG